MKVASVGTALPPHYYDQERLIEALRGAWSQRHYNVDRIEQLHRNVLVGGRHLALPIEDYEDLSTWGKANDAWIRVAQEVGEAAVRDGLERAGLTAADVSAMIFVTVTGVATPSIEARLINRMDLPSNMKRMPIFGLGCVAGTAGVARAADYLRGHPHDVVVLLSVELCSLTLQRTDLSIPNLIASGLFGDGAAAAVLVGAERSAAGPRVVASRSIFYRDSERVMGWDISEEGFKIVLSADVPEVVQAHLREDVDAFLGEHGLRRDDVAAWISHPGGPRVLHAMQEALEVDEAALEASWRTLREVGNLSSTSVLMVLESIMRERPPEPGGYGVMVAMGPGFCSELVLLQW
jgi:alkylresorcinol/alkylpyrone synthase